MLGQSDAGQNVLRLSLTENCSSYTNSAYIYRVFHDFRA